MLVSLNSSRRRCQQKVRFAWQGGGFTKENVCGRWGGTREKLGELSDDDPDEGD